MRFRRLLTLLVIVPLLPALQAQEVEVQERVLSNGMRLLIVERHEAPTIAAGWVARVGSVNERPGITGISHLFEHMMFKGTETIGTTSHQMGAEVMAEQDRIRKMMEEEYRELRRRKLRGEITGNIYDPENMTPRLKELKDQLTQLYEKEREYIVKDELDQIYTREGASGLNAFTTEDQTAYIITIPANKLELWFWLESDRLLNPVFREFYSERDVVREERRLRVESTPTGRLNELFNASFWQSSPYSWPVIGWATDVESITREQAADYFATYYAPNNITAVLVGDVDPDQAVELAEKYFGRIPRGEKEPPEVITFEVEQLAEKRFTGEADTNPSVRIRFHAPPFNHKDSFPLQLLADALNGRTGRLYSSLVEEKQLAVGEPVARLAENKYAGYFQLSAEVKEGRTHEEVEAALLGELEKLQEEPLPERELQKVKNQELADSFRRLQNNFFLLLQLMIYDSNDHWSYINKAPERLQAVTAQEIQGAARQYFKKENRNIAWYKRKAGSEPEDPALAGFPPQVRNMLRQQIAQIEVETDVDRLQEALDQTRQMQSQAPPPMQPAVEHLIGKIVERIEELNSNEGDN